MRRSYKVNILAYIDNDDSKWGSKCNGIEIMPPQSVLTMNYDEILISIYDYASILQVIKQLMDMGVQEKKIVPIYVSMKYDDIFPEPRKNYFKDYAMFGMHIAQNSNWR